MNAPSLDMSTREIQALDSAHFIHPFTDHGDLATRGARVITRAENIYVWESTLLPGTIAPGANVVPTSPNSAANQVSSVPALVPHSTAPNGLPDHAAIVPPALDSRLGQISLAVPEGYVASAPRRPEAPVSPFGPIRISNSSFDSASGHSVACTPDASNPW